MQIASVDQIYYTQRAYIHVYMMYIVRFLTFLLILPSLSILLILVLSIRKNHFRFRIHLHSFHFLFWLFHSILFLDRATFHCSILLVNLLREIRIEFSVVAWYVFVVNTFSFREFILTTYIHIRFVCKNCASFNLDNIEYVLIISSTYF